MEDPFIDIAKEAHYNIYGSPMWNNTGRRFAELIVKQCLDIIDKSEGDLDFASWQIKKQFLNENQ